MIDEIGDNALNSFLECRLFSCIRRNITTHRPNAVGKDFHLSPAKP